MAEVYRRTGWVIEQRGSQRRFAAEWFGQPLLLDETEKDHRMRGLQGRGIEARAVPVEVLVREIPENEVERREAGPADTRRAGTLTEL